MKTPKLLLIIALALCQQAFSQTSTWVLPTAGNWSTASNWSPTGAPAAGADLVFQNRLVAGYTATNDLVAYSARSITFDARIGTYTSGPVLAGATLATAGMTLSGAGAAITQSGGGAAGITGGLVLGGAVDVNGAGNGTLVLSGVISGSGPLSFSRSNAAGQTIVSGVNIFSSGSVLNSRQLAIGNASALGSGALTVNGGTLRMDSFVGPSGITLANNITANSTVRFNGNNSGIFSGVISGTGGFTNQAAVGNTTRLTNANTYSGATTAAAAPTATSNNVVQFEGNGSALNSSSYKAEGFTTLNLDNSGTNMTNRLADSVPLTLQRATFAFTGNASAASSETIGATSFSGFSTISVATGSGQSAAVTAASLTRQDRGVLFTRGLGLGSGVAGTASLFFTSSPVADLIGGGGAVSTTNQSILPYVVARGANAGNADTFATYDANGVRALLATEFISAITDGTSSTDNARLTASGTINSPTTVNSLVLAGGTVTGSGSLSVTSGAVLIASGTPTISTALAFGTAEAVFTTQGNTTVGAAMTGSNGLTKAGTSTLTFTTAPAITGALTVNAGAVGVATDALLGSFSSIALNGGRLNYTNTGSETTTRSISTGVAGGTLDITSATGILTVNSSITGSGALVKQNSGTVVLGMANTYTGNTVITGGVLSVSNGNQLGSGAQIVMSSSGTLRSTSAMTAAKDVLLTGGGGSATFDTPADLTISGGVSHNGTPTNAFPMTKTGGGRLTLNGNNTVNGIVDVNQGYLYINGTLQAANTVSAGLSVAAGAGLGGSGVIERSVNFAAGTFIDPGASPGTLTIAGDITLAGSVGYNWERFGATYDFLLNQGGTTLNGGILTLFLNDLGGGIPASEYLIWQSDSFAGTMPTFAIDYTNAPAFSAGLGYQVRAESNKLYLAAVPEPTRAWLLALGFSMLCLRRRR